MKEILCKKDVDPKEVAEHVRMLQKSAFFDQDDLAKYIESAVAEAIRTAKDVERVRIEEYIYDHPESVEENRKKWAIKKSWLSKSDVKPRQNRAERRKRS